MEIIPVIDLLDGRVVRGIAGRRDEYRPVRSSLCGSADPSVVLRAFHEMLGLHSCYIADLDALQGGQLNRCVLAELSRFPVQLMIDRGLRSAEDVRELFELGAASAIVALECLPGLEFARRLVTEFGSDRLIISLDLKQGALLTSVNEFQQQTPFELACQLIDAGFTRMIVLDLAAVGMLSGPASLQLCLRIRKRFPRVELISGGGVRSMDDLITMKNAKLSGALVASSLHDGSIGIRELEQFRDV